MMTLTSLGMVPASLPLTFSFAVGEMMVAMLVVSTLGIAAAALRVSIRPRRGHDAGALLPVARQALAA